MRAEQFIIDSLVSLVKQSGNWEDFNQQMAYYDWLLRVVNSGYLNLSDLPARPIPSNFYAYAEN